MRPGGLQLAIALQNIPAGIADSKAVRGQGGPAPNEVAPGHSLGMVTEPGGGGAAGSQSVQIDGFRGCGPQAEQENPRQHARPLISSRHLNQHAQAQMVPRWSLAPSRTPTIGAVVGLGAFIPIRHVMARIDAVTWASPKLDDLVLRPIRPKRSEQVLQVNSLKLQYSLTATTESARMAALLDFNRERHLGQTNTERIEEKNPGLV